MKVYVGSIKKGDQYQYGVSIFSEKGVILNTSTKHHPVLPNKFDNVLDLLAWVTQKVKTLSQNKTISEDESIVLFTSSKTVYTWFEKELAPEPYTVPFSNLLLELSFLLNPLEIIYSKTAEKKVIYKNTIEDKPVRITDLFADVVVE